MKKIKIAALAAAVAAAGCMSVERAKSQLASSDPAEAAKGRNAVYIAATTGRDDTGFVQFTTQQQLEFVALAPDAALLNAIIDGAHDSAVIAAAMKRLDLSAKGAAAEFIRTTCLDSLFRDRGAPRAMKFAWLDADDKAEIAAKAVSALTTPELLALASAEPPPGDRFSVFYKLDGEVKRLIQRRLEKETTDPAVLLKMVKGEIGFDLSNDADARLALVRRIVAAADKVAGKTAFEELLKDGALAASDRVALMKLIPEERAVEIALHGLDSGYIRNFDGVERYSDFEWNRGNVATLEVAAETARFVKDRKARIRITAAVLSKIEGFKEECKKNSFMSWGKRDKQLYAKVRDALPALNEAETAAVMCMDGDAWRALAASASPATARRALASGRVKSEELEEALAARVPDAEIDLALYDAVKSDEAKKALAGRMPESVKREVATAKEKAVAAITAKATAAAKETFASHGFYLKMPLEDAKAMYLHLFPDGDATFSKDGLALYVSDQSDPLCRAYSDTKNVREFNFGRAILRKWHKYDAGTFGKWAKAYGREHGIEMSLDWLDRDGEVYVPNGMLELEPYAVSLHQEIHVGRDASRGFVVTYFGEPKIHSYGGPYVKALAKDKYSAVSAAAGTLRVEVDD